MQPAPRSGQWRPARVKEQVVERLRVDRCRRPAQMLGGGNRWCDRRRCRGDERARHADAGADGAENIGKAGRLLGRCGRRRIGRRTADVRGSRKTDNRKTIRTGRYFAKMHVAERQHELARQREKREPYHAAPVRPEPTHASRPQLGLRTPVDMAAVEALATSCRGGAR